MPKILCALVVWGGASATVAMPAEAQAPPIIDMHLHTYDIPAGWDPDEWAELWLPEGYEAPGSSEDLRRATFEALDEHNVVRAWATGPGESALSWKEHAPTRLLAATEFLEEGSFPSVDELRAGYLSGELDGLGELVAQIAGLTPSDPFFAPISH